VLVAALGTLEREGVARFTTRRVASSAQTSTPAVYELFGDKAGLVRAVFFLGFAQLAGDLAELPETPDARADLLSVVVALRRFVRRQPVLAEVMFARPFADFDPGPDERAAGDAVRSFIVGRVRRAVALGARGADPVDAAHAVLALAQGLAAQERAGWLGTSPASLDRRWALAANALLDGLVRSVR
jgi:AcrR family transcriptional regulator